MKTKEKAKVCLLHKQWTAWWKLLVKYLVKCIETTVIKSSSSYNQEHSPHKGKIISKRLLLSSDSSKKRTNKFFCLTVLKTNLFFCFLEGSEDTKKSFRNYLTFTWWCFGHSLAKSLQIEVHCTNLFTVTSHLMEKKCDHWVLRD